MVTAVKSPDQHVETTRSIIQQVMGSYHPRDFTIRLWNGTVYEADAGQPTRFTIVLNHPGALRKMLMPPIELNLGEAYIYQDFDVEGDLSAIFTLGDTFINKKWSIAESLWLGLQLLRLPSKRQQVQDSRQAASLNGNIHSRNRDRQAITYHYDVSNDFYSLWLDKNMVYSCAYFASLSEDIDTAQERKLDYICRKLRLKAGERFLDIGCGWGGLIIHAAKHYGVTAHGISLSQAQVDLANKRIQEAGLEDHCYAEVRDYRDFAEGEQVDKIASVGMVEHVGLKKLPEYFQQARKLLRPGGVFLNHGIAAHNYITDLSQPSFINRYVFPDGELIPIGYLLRIAEENGFEVRDVESLREHYAMTLNHWIKRLEANKKQALNLVDEVTYRIWRLYMSAAEYTFKARTNNVFQVLLSKDDHSASTLPLNRSDWYASMR